MSFTVLEPRPEDVPVVEPDKVQELEGRVAAVEQAVQDVAQSVASKIAPASLQ